MAFNTELDRDAKAMKTCLVFSCIIGCWEIDPEDIVELFLG